jgi:membrane fusion protein, heavy metal efflux system
VGAGRDLIEAEAALEEANVSLEAARRQLRVQGLAQADVERLETEEEAATSVEVRAPFAGRVLDVRGVVGEAAGPDHPLFLLADLRRLRLDIDVYEADLPKVEKDQHVLFRLEGLPGERFVGHVEAVGGEVNETSRTIPVIAEIKNHRDLLRAKMFGKAEISVRPAGERILIPSSALQTDGDCWFVFTNPIGDVFKTRAVQVGTAYEGCFEIRGGLAPGEQVVTSGSFLLKTEVLRGEMGAG